MVDNEVNVEAMNQTMDIQATPEIETTDNGNIKVEPTFIREEVTVINKGACIACGAAGLVTGLITAWAAIKFVVPKLRKNKVEEPEESKEA